MSIVTVPPMVRARTTFVDAAMLLAMAAQRPPPADGEDEDGDAPAGKAAQVSYAEVLERALGEAVRDLQQLRDNAQGGAQQEIFRAHQELLDDPSLLQQAEALIVTGKSAAFAWNRATFATAKLFQGSGNALLAERAADLAALLRDDNAHFYVCGLKSMEEGVVLALRDVAQQSGLDWEQVGARLKREGRLHLETY